MAKWMEAARDFLGLGEDPYYDDDYDDYENAKHEDPYGPVEESTETPRNRRPSNGRYHQPDAGPWDGGEGGVRMIHDEPDETVAARPPDSSAGPDGTAAQRRRGRAASPTVTAVAPASPPSDRGVVRPLPTTAKPEVVSPGRFDDVQAVADAFKKTQPVIINLQGVDRDLSRRLIDFASGLCYGLEGEMERVAEQVFLLTPRGAEVSDDDRRRLASGELREYDS